MKAETVLANPTIQTEPDDLLEGVIAAPEPDVDACPKCASTTPWRGCSWCPDCGFYPLAAELEIDDNTAGEPEEAEPEEQPRRKPLLPVWIQILFGGCVVLLGANFGVKYYFQYHEGDVGLMALMELIGGLASLLAVQCWATVVAMRRNTQIKLLDAFTSPFDVWTDTIQHLPKSHLRISIGVWGICAAVFSVAILGGFSVDRLFGPPIEKSKPKPLTFFSFDKEEAEDEEEDDLEGSMRDFVDRVGVAEVETQEHNPRMTCRVYGYMTDGTTAITRILLAADVKGEFKHIAELQMSELPESLQTDLAERLPELRTDENEVATPYAANWVHPITVISIKSDGRNIDGTLKDPRVVKTPKPVP